jgi:metallo-beta-lactamase class B
MRRRACLHRLCPLLAATILGACGSGTAASTTTPATVSTTTPDEDFVPRSIDIDDDLTIREVSDGVYVITHAFPWPGNSMLVEMASGDLVFVDTPYTPEATEAVLSWFEDELGSRAIVEINTGYHVDNLGGNEYLVDAGIRVYGSEETAVLLEERGEATRALLLSWLQSPEDARFYDAHAEVAYVPPDHRFPLDDGLELQFGDQSVQVYFPGPTHAPDNVVVYFPDRKLLFGGCMILAGDSVGNDADADLEAWSGSIENLFQFDVEMVVPGHGDRLDPGLLRNTIEVLAET